MAARIKEARFALGGVAHKPWRNGEAEAALRGKAGRAKRRSRKAADLVLRDAKGFGAQHLQDRAGAPRHRPRAVAGGARHAAVAVQQEDRVSNAMAPYIGTATSRVDGIAKVTGAAKYAAEFNVPGPGPCERRRLDDRQGPHHAHRHQRGHARQGRARPC